MKELNDIVRAYDEAVLASKKTALVTVVKVVGSSYRRPGARMLVTEDGLITGAISGGCLEGDALRKAQLAIFEGQNRLEIYDTTDDEDNRLGVQLGCNGIVYILFEPIDEKDKYNPIILLKKVAGKRVPAVLVTVFNESWHAWQQGTCGLLTDEYFEVASYKNGLEINARRTLEQRLSVVEKEDDDTVLYQFIPPAIQLVVVGAGNDTQPLVKMAATMGWSTVVADGRPAYATRQRFPEAGQIIITKPAHLLSHIVVDAQTALVLMTHNYNYDVELLKLLQQTSFGYVGLLGPRQKMQQMLDELFEQNLYVREAALYGPVGLDIGAETSEEIALSVMAEIKAVFAGRKGMSLRERKFTIHSRQLIEDSHG